MVRGREISYHGPAHGGSASFSQIDINKKISPASVIDLKIYLPGFDSDDFMHRYGTSHAEIHIPDKYAFALSSTIACRT